MATCIYRSQCLFPPFYTITYKLKDFTCIIQLPVNVYIIMWYQLQVNEKSFDLKEGIEGWYKKEGDKTGMNGCMLPW